MRNKTNNLQKNKKKIIYIIHLQFNALLLYTYIFPKIFQIKQEKSFTSSYSFEFNFSQIFILMQFFVC